MFSCEDEEREGTFKVLAVLVYANAVSKAVGKEVLGGHVSTVGVGFEEGGSLLYEIFMLFDSFSMSMMLAGVRVGMGRVLDASTITTANSNWRSGS
jgi:hypothetical protein